MNAPSPLPPLPGHPVGSGWALFFDVDGTLAELMPRPEDVVIDPDIVGALSRLFDLLDGAVAIVSGRPIAQIDDLLQPLILPAGGLHGLERRLTSDGKIVRDATPLWRDEIATWIGDFADAHPGVWLEDKGVTLALHFRGAPDREKDVLALTDRIKDRGLPGLAVQHGKFIVEFRPAGADKGDTIEHFIGRAPFKGRRPVFLGDDVTDEHGFEAVKRSGGTAIRVGAAADTAADWTLPDVAAARQWILDLTAALDDGAHESRT